MLKTIYLFMVSLLHLLDQCKIICAWISETTEEYSIDLLFLVIRHHHLHIMTGIRSCSNSHSSQECFQKFCRTHYSMHLLSEKPLFCFWSQEEDQNLLILIQTSGGLAPTHINVWYDLHVLIQSQDRCPLGPYWYEDWVERWDLVQAQGKITNVKYDLEVLIKGQG